jgi:hypothetical protein
MPDTEADPIAEVRALAEEAECSSIAGGTDHLRKAVGQLARAVLILADIVAPEDGGPG